MTTPTRAALATAGLAGLLLATGCAPPDGIDRDLTGGWGTIPAAVGWLPEVGTCHPDDYQSSSTLIAYRPVSCQQQHLTETVQVGEFTGAAADRVTPPPDGSAEWQAAYGECDQAAADYLGADFRHGMLWLGVTVPSVAAWEGGARWFRCEVVGFDVQDDSFGGRLGSLAGALEVDTDLRLGCFESTVSDDGEFVEQMDQVACDEPHDTEFVGVWRAPDVPYLDPEDEDSEARVYRGCLEQAAAYVDVPVDGNLIFRTGTIASWMGELDWDNGDRGFRCYLWLDDGDLTESLEGAGTAGLPVR